MHVWSRWWARLNAHQLRKRITTQTHQTLEKLSAQGCSSTTAVSGTKNCPFLTIAWNGTNTNDANKRQAE